MALITVSMMPGTLAESGDPSPGVVIEPADHDSTWFIAPYLWIPDVEGSTTLGPAQVDLDIDARELSGGLNAAAMGYLQWRRGSHFIYIDGLGLRFEDEKFEPFFNQAVEAETIFTEVGYGRHFCVRANWTAARCTSLQLYVGVRYAEVNVEVSSPAGAVTADESWLDPALGLIARQPLSESLSLMIKLDAAGFGVGRDDYWNAIGGLYWQLAERWSVAAGYRAAQFDAEPGGSNDLELELKGEGPIGGVSYTF